MTSELASTRAGGGEISGRAETGLIRCGAEIVELTERFYRGIFLGITVFVGVAALAALILLPLRAGAGGPPPAGVIGACLLIAATPIALLRNRRLYRLLRRRLVAELAVVLYAAALVSTVFPLRSQLWWPSCTLLMLLAAVAPIRRVLAYCLTVLAVNLLAHLLSGDIDRAPAVSIIGLWVGYLFWSMAVAAISNQLAAHLMRLNSPAVTFPAQARRVVSWRFDQPPAREEREESDTQRQPDRTGPDNLAGPAEVAHVPSDDAEASPSALDRLTARQLQVLALLVDGLRYREVAACLSITENQVQRHVAGAVTRLQVRNALELVALAVREGLAPTQR